MATPPAEAASAAAPAATAATPPPAPAPTPAPTLAPAPALTPASAPPSSSSSSSRVRTKEFQLAWIDKFGVQVAARDLATGEVLSVKCLFCEQFGREGAGEGGGGENGNGEQGRKRKRTANVQHFKKPWRGDNIKSHLLKQHALRYEHYKALTLLEKNVYFQAKRTSGGDNVSASLPLQVPSPVVGTDGGVQAQGRLLVPVAAAVVKSQPQAEPHSMIAAESVAGAGGETQETTRDPTVAAADAAEGMSRLVESPGVQQLQKKLFQPPHVAVISVGVPAATNAAVQPPEYAAAFPAMKIATGPGFQLLIDKKIALFVEQQLLALEQQQSDATLGDFVLQTGDKASSSADAVDFDTGRYLVRVNDSHQFDLTLKFLVAGFSLQQCAKLIQETDQTQTSSHYRSQVIKYSRFICAMNFQAIANMLRSAWAFSLVLDAGRDGEAPYTDVRVRFAVSEKIHDVHLVTLPNDEKKSQSPRALIERVTHAIAAVCPGSWQAKLVGIATDDSASVTGNGHLSGVFAFLQQAASSSGCYSVWCGARQVESVIQGAFSKLCDDKFVSTLVALTGYLRRRKKNLIGSSCCPAFKSSHWMSVRELLTWLVDNSAALREHFDLEKSVYTPEGSWWVAVYSLQAVVKLASACMLSIEGLTTYGAEQNRSIEKLLITLVADGYVDGPSRFQEAKSSVLKGEYRVTYESAEMFIQKQDPFVAELLTELGNDNREQHTKVLDNVATMLAEATSDLAKLRSERARMAGLSDILPSVRPQDLVRTTTEFDFRRLVSLQRDRLKFSLRDDEIKTIEEEFKGLLAAYKNEQALKKVLDSLPPNASFAKSWRSLSERFPSLCRFVGGLASVYRDPRAVGLDSTWMSGSSQISLSPAVTSVALDSILHAKQFAILQQLSND